MKAYALVAVLLFGACSDDSPIDMMVCSQPDMVKVNVSSAPARLPVTGDLPVFGEVVVPDDVTVFGVVLGARSEVSVDRPAITAISTAPNFRTWTATIPIEVLLGATAGAQGTVHVTADAITNCPEDPAPGTSSSFPIAPPPAM